RALPTGTPRRGNRPPPLRCPSLWNGLVARIARISATTSRSLCAVFGPRFVAASAGARAPLRAYTDGRGPRPPPQLLSPGIEAAAFEPLLPALQEHAAPFLDLVHRHLDLARHRVERLTPDEPEDDLHLLR